MKTLRFSVSALLVALSALAFASHANACEYNFNFVASADVNDIINDGSLSDPDIPKADCERLGRLTPFLKEHNVKFLITSDHFVSNGVSTAWAAVWLQDRYGIVSKTFGVSTRVQSDPSDLVARQLSRYAIIKALFKVRLHEGLASLRKDEIKNGLTPIPALPDATSSH